MEKDEKLVIKSKRGNSGDFVSKRLTISQETYKALKIKSIELELDEDGKITPEILGKTLDAVIVENEQLRKCVAVKSIEGASDEK